ncbi:MAG: TetR/AcrR family transcriptional regulator [Pseudomonadota bacterium]
MSDTAQLSEKQTAILDCALALLTETGDAGLTMRKLAERAGMRLSNVQYYFRSRDDVLTATTARYVADCTAEIRALTEAASEATLRERTHLLIETGLRHGDELSDMCRTFRELWAISSRNDAVQADLAAYYRSFGALIADFVLGDAATAAQRDRVASLLLPFFEGYSVTAASVPLSTDAVATMLTELAVSVSAEDNSPAP